MDNNNALKNYEATKKAIGYVERKKATQADYDRIGFMSGLEVHQQLLTKKKLFCHCPAGFYQQPDEFDAELIRHMRPTLSELGEYDGTALMEFRTKKEIIYRIANKTACTYDVDDTPPFPIDWEAIDIAIEISLLSKLKVVGEIHITRKQYLDGSIPTGFQRTAIIGVDGELTLRNGRKIGLIQLSVEEDSCREVSDIGHRRIYRTDRLGMPLIETVTHPDMKNPDEVKEVCDHIRFLNRSTNKVRTGIGAGREDVNVSCRGGHRVEIKGVARTNWIPELTHNEAFRQWALLHIREILTKRCKKEDWKLSAMELLPSEFSALYEIAEKTTGRKEKMYAVNLPCFKDLLSHFTQPNYSFHDEFVHRLKVIACIERPNMTSSEDLQPLFDPKSWNTITKKLNAGADDAQIVFWGPDEDIKTALETIEERALMTFDGIPPETRKSFEDGTTIFERVLPGADRMYPDTDSVPIPLEDAYIDKLRKNVAEDFSERYQQFADWEIPEDTYRYIFSKNYYPLMQRIINELSLNPKFIGVFFGHRLKHLHGQHKTIPFAINKIYDLFVFLKDKQLDTAIAPSVLLQMFLHPDMDFESILTDLKFKKISKADIISRVRLLENTFAPVRKNTSPQDKINSIMGGVRAVSVGNVNLSELVKEIK
ncbi:MAG: Glu-tRNA(Gln) amidotransferase subunit GatE [Bacteroidales bacterium]|nr:Glu-tRNA(Gln) amidotransferase subunit GatE [Bacteroidales bacterium]MCL2132959.1 Glu-tRNA(Gln) amidotransferase subunit GatE [Bacteroidales bacterium]MCL2133398.1 Glu-tRNA(Gln) amidotransferase subunit GatE [Bacteroidales bacterium]